MALAERRVLHGVPPFTYEPDAGAQAIGALSAVLRFLGQTPSLHELAAVSGEALRFAYDCEDVFEPLRDLWPEDLYARAGDVYGFRGHWVVDEERKRTLRAIQACVDRGFPAIVPYFLSKPYHGFYVVSGYDLTTNRLYLVRGYRPDERPGEYLGAEIPAEWCGPVPGSVRWGTNPVFVLDTHEGPTLEPLERLRGVFERALNYARGPPLAYPRHLSAHDYSGIDLGGREAPQGLAALELLAQELVLAEPLADFALHWRLRTLLGQLAHHREAAALYLDECALTLGGELGLRLQEAGAFYRAVSSQARALSRAAWDSACEQARDADEARQLIRRSQSFVFSLRLAEAERRNLAARLGGTLFEGGWGHALVLDNEDRRRAHGRAAQALRAREEQALASVEAALALLPPPTA